MPIGDSPIRNGSSGEMVGIVEFIGYYLLTALQVWARVLQSKSVAPLQYSPVWHLTVAFLKEFQGLPPFPSLPCHGTGAMSHLAPCRADWERHHS